MEIFLQIAPLALLILGVAIIIWRGMRTKPDNTNNEARGGGSDSHYQE
ncbi:MAG: hypothetical protein HKN27_02275 [Silicimonas sp.]|nr:hypothetical protein [Silicimonas sp.]